MVNCVCFSMGRLHNPGNYIQHTQAEDKTDRKHTIILISIVIYFASFKSMLQRLVAWKDSGIGKGELI